MDLSTWGPDSDNGGGVGPDMRTYEHHSYGYNYYFLNWFHFNDTDGTSDIQSGLVQRNNRRHRMYCDVNPYNTASVATAEVLLEVEWQTGDNNGGYFVNLQGTMTRLANPFSGDDSNHFNDSHIVLRWDSAYLQRFKVNDPAYLLGLNKFCWVCIERIWNDMQWGTEVTGLACEPSANPQTRIIISMCQSESKGYGSNYYTFPVTGWGHTHRYECASGVISGVGSKHYDRACQLSYHANGRPKAEWEPYLPCVAESEYCFFVNPFIFILSLFHSIIIVCCRYFLFR